jgi:hypothetical protein
LVDQWWIQFKGKASIKLAAVFAVIVGVLTANPILVVGLIGFLPDGLWKWVIGLAVALVVFAIPALASVWRQPKLTAKVEEAKNAADS